VRTYLLLTLDSEGAPLSEIAELVEDLGLRPTGDGYDFVHDWGRPASVRESLELADRLQAALRGKRVYFRLESGEE
jgi:hypothetical protein